MLAPGWLLLLPLAILPLAVLRRPRIDPAIPLPTTHEWPGKERDGPRRWLPWLRSAVLALLAIALAGPVYWTSDADDKPSADLMLVLDMSGSMAARDLLPDRLAAARSVLRGFIRRHPQDRIGLVLFRAGTLTACPLTHHHAGLEEALERASPADLPEDGTALGDALAVAVARLGTDRTRSRAVILLTDGVSNAGKLLPDQAAELAAASGITVHTVAVGRDGGAPVPVREANGRIGWARGPDGRIFLTRVDHDGLVAMARRTGGTSFRAGDTAGLGEAYRRVDALVRSRLPDGNGRRNPHPLTGALTLLASLLLFTDLWIRRGPGAVASLPQQLPDGTP